MISHPDAKVKRQQCTLFRVSRNGSPITNGYRTLAMSCKPKYLTLCYFLLLILSSVLTPVYVHLFDLLINLSPFFPSSLHIHFPVHFHIDYFSS